MSPAPSMVFKKIRPEKKIGEPEATSHKIKFGSTLEAGLGCCCHLHCAGPRGLMSLLTQGHVPGPRKEKTKTRFSTKQFPGIKVTTSKSFLWS